MSPQLRAASRCATDLGRRRASPSLSAAPGPQESALGEAGGEGRGGESKQPGRPRRRALSSARWLPSLSFLLPLSPVESRFSERCPSLSSAPRSSQGREVLFSLPRPQGEWASLYLLSQGVSCAQRGKRVRFREHPSTPQPQEMGGFAESLRCSRVIREEYEPAFPRVRRVTETERGQAWKRTKRRELAGFISRPLTMVHARTAGW